MKKNSNTDGLADSDCRGPLRATVDRLVGGLSLPPSLLPHMDTDHEAAEEKKNGKPTILKADREVSISAIQC